MKKLIAGSLIVLSTACSTATSDRAPGSSPAQPDITVQKSGNVTAYETKGNLAVTRPTGCVDVRQLSSSSTPADIYTGISDCLSNGDIDRAVRLYGLAYAYGYYDHLRVADRTAHQATKVLELNHLSGVDDDVTQKMTARVGEISDDERALGALCDDIKSLGRPSYHPDYMIQHGIQAFSGGRGDGLVRDFSEREGWQKALDQGLRCPA